MNPVSTSSSRRTLLNPNAREFVPTCLKSSSSANITTTGDETEPSIASDNGKTLSDKTVSSDTCASDEESRRYWNAQLPDDILTPDTDLFIPVVEDDIEPGSTMLGASASKSSGMKESADYVADNLSWERNALNGKEVHSSTQGSAYDFATSCNAPRQFWEEEHASPPFQLSSLVGNWNGQLSRSGNGSLYPPAFGHAASKENNTMDALNVLSNEFPNIPVQTLAEVYQANYGDLGLTMRLLSQIKLQDETSLWHNIPSPSRFSPNSRILDFSAPSTPELSTEISHFLDDIDTQHSEFPRLVRKNTSQWPRDCQGLSEFSLGPSSFSSANAYSAFLDGEPNEDRYDLAHLHHKHRGSPRNWVETDDALVNLLSELKEEERNHGRIRNVYFEQARQAFYVGNRSLAKEASAKGQFHNRLMKAAQNKAAEIDIQRSMSNTQVSSFGPGQTQLLDLRGLHVNEAINLLKRDLSVLRLAARTSRQRQQVFISVGTGHQKGSRTPARLLCTVKRYLVEEELLSCTEPQPGILKVVVS